jgi:hypothetical protein
MEGLLESPSPVWRAVLDSASWRVTVVVVEFRVVKNSFFSDR